MNPRQRRGVLLMGLAIVGAVAVFVSVFSYVSEVRSRVGDPVVVLELTAPVEAFQPLPVDSFREVEVPSRYAPDAPLSRDQVLSQVPATNLEAGTVLQDSLMTNPPALRPGEQEIAVTVDAETGVAGQLLPESRVDVYATFRGGTETGSVARQDCSMLLIRNARVLLVGTEKQSAQESPEGDLGAERVVPVTFALPPALASQLVYAESFAQEVRLALNSAQAPESENAIDATAPQGGRGSRAPKPGECSLPPGLSFPGGA